VVGGLFAIADGVQTLRHPEPVASLAVGVAALLIPATLEGLSWGTVASGDHSNRRPPPESLNAIGDARIDCFEHF
jgi:hypothetical protein